MFPINFKPDLLTLPFKVSIRETGQPLTLAQANALISQGEAGFVRIERSYPGAPDASGWTLFECTAHAYIHTGDPLFAEEHDARRHIYKACAICRDLNGEDALTYSLSHIF